MNKRQHKKHNSLLEQLCNKKIRLPSNKKGCNYNRLSVKRFYKSVYQLNRKRIKPLNEDKGENEL